MSIRLTIFRKGLILVAVPLLFQLAFIALIARNEQKAVEASRWFAHSKEVLQQANHLLMSLADAETAARGYILSGNHVFTEQFERARRDVPVSLERLKKLVSDNPEQVQRTALLEAKIVKWFAWQVENAELVGAGHREQAAERVKTLEGQLQMDGLRESLAVFHQAEARLDNTRQEALETARQELQWVLVIGTGTSLLLTVVLVMLFSRSISGRLAVLSGNARNLAQGNDQFAAVGGRDEIATLDQVFRQTARDLAAAHAALEKQSRLLQSVLDSMGEGVVVADEQGKFLIFNPAAERLLGLGPTEGPASQWSAQYRIFLPDQTTPYPSEDLPLARAMRGETVDSAELYVRSPDTLEGRWLDVTGRPLSGPDGMRGGGVVVIRDMTETRQAKEALRQLNEELEHRVDERTADLAEANRDLAQKNQENETFVYSVSHDLRSPLVNLQGFSQELASVSRELRGILARQEVPSELREQGLALVDNDMAESINFIQTSVMRLSRIIDALLRLSRAGRVEYQRKPVDVEAIVTTVVTSLAGTIDQKGAQVSIGSLPVAWGDPTAIEQVFANLIGNALNYLDPARLGSVEIGSNEEITSPETEPPFRTYYVRDNGLGIPEAYRPKLFQAFQRLHPEVAQGEGMGLAMVRRIVERHGGRIWVESNEKGGSVFFVTLPVGEANSRETALRKNFHKERDSKDDSRAIGCIAGGR